MRPDRQVVTETADDAPIPVSLVQYLCAQWWSGLSEERDAVIDLLGRLIASPHWHWPITALSAHVPTDLGSCVFEHDGQRTIGIPSTILWDIWVWVLKHPNERVSVLRWLAPTLDPALWQRLRAWQTSYAPGMTPAHRYRLYPYLLPTHLPELVQEIHQLLSSDNPNDQHIALTVLDRWLASPDSATRTLAAQMLHTLLNEEHHLRLPIITILAASGDATVDVDRWAHHVAAFIRTHPSDRMIQDTLDRLMPAIWSSVRPDDRVAWVVTLWDLMNESTLGGRCLMIAGVLAKMMQQDPMVARLVCDRLRTVSPLHRSRLPFIPRRTWDTLLAGLIRTVCADEVLTIIEQEIRQDPDAIARFDPIVAAGWGNGRDGRILQMVTSHPSLHWREVIAAVVTTSVGVEVCTLLGSRVPADQCMDMVMIQLQNGEQFGNLPLAPLPASLIPWVGDTARTRPYRLHPTTIRRLWLTDPDRAWNVTQIMLDSGHRFVQQRAIAAMDTGWGTGHDAEVATTLRARILEHQDDRDGIEAGITTAVAGLGIAPPSLIAALLTELAMQGNETVQRQLISALRRGWGRGQDDLVVRIVKTIADRMASTSVWRGSCAMVTQAWHHLPPQFVVHLIDWLLTHARH
jgi:hypothetical protein